MPWTPEERAAFEKIQAEVVNFTAQEAEELGIRQCAICREWKSTEALVSMEYRPAKDTEGLEPVPARVWWRCPGCGAKEWG